MLTMRPVQVMKLSFLVKRWRRMLNQQLVDIELFDQPGTHLGFPLPVREIRQTPPCLPYRLDSES